jgi:DNA-binding phage protein
MSKITRYDPELIRIIYEKTKEIHGAINAIAEEVSMHRNSVVKILSGQPNTNTASVQLVVEAATAHILKHDEDMKKSKAKIKAKLSKLVN